MSRIIFFAVEIFGGGFRSAWRWTARYFWKSFVGVVFLEIRGEQFAGCKIFNPTENKQSEFFI